MKNFVTVLFLLAGACATTAQIAPAPAPQTPGGTSNSTPGDASAFKPRGGDLTFEMNFNPFSAAPLSLNYLRTRLFMGESMALRTGITVGISSSDPNKSFQWGLLPGIEKHFSGAERLSPYIGGELILGGKSSSSSAKTNSVTTTTKGSHADGSNRGYFNFGLNAVAGCDFYFSKRIYMGIEAGFGMSLMSYSDVTISVIPNGGSTIITTTEGGSSFQLGPNYNSAIRVGFVF